MQILKNRNRIKKIVWGVAGLGKFSETAFLPTLNLILRAKGGAVFSHDAIRAKNIAEKFGISAHFNNFDDFLKSNIDAVFIAGDNASHYWQVLAAARAGKNILCEKPIAINSKQAEEMVRVCKENNVLFAVDYPIRFNPLVQKAAELLQNQTIGKLITINAQFGVNFPPDDNYRFNKSLSGGGALWDIGTHIIDLFRFIAGDVLSISGKSLNLHFKSEVEDFTYANLVFKNHGLGYFNVSFCTKKAFNRLEITGSNGAIMIENLYGPRISPARMTIILDGERKKVFKKRASHFHRMLRSVNHSFIHNTTPFVTGEDGLINVRLMEELESNGIN